MAGAVEKGEDPRFAAFREAIEEVGVAAISLRKVYEGQHVGKGGEPYTAHVYLASGMLATAPTNEDGTLLANGVSALDLTGSEGQYPDLMARVFEHLAMTAQDPRG